MIVIADLHFGKENDSYTKNGMPSQRADLLLRLGTVSHIAEQTGQALVIAGDVFNRVNPTSAVISAFFDWLSGVGTEVYIIPGNHDSGADWLNVSMVSSARLSNVTVVTEPEIKVVSDSTGSRNVAFYPHISLASRGITPSMGDIMIRDGEKAADILITHGQVVGIGYQNDIFFEAGDALEIDLRDLPKGSLVFAGHVHNGGQHNKGATTLVYPGSLTVNNFGEVDETKSFIEVSLEDREWVTIPFSEEDGVTPWRHVEVDLTEKDEHGIDEDLLAEFIDGAVIKVTVITKNYGVVDESAIRALFNKYGHVARFETKYTDAAGHVEDAINTDVSHTKLLNEWLGTSDAGSKEKSAARKLGEEIITEVLG